MSDTRREEVEGRYSRWRITELDKNPVVGKFDAAHLKEVNRRIFQDLPRLGFDDVTPGEFRKPVPDGGDWKKQRGLETVNGSFFVAYSRMDDKAQERLDKVLESANPDEFRHLKTPEFVARLGKLYVELDYIHPFPDGNTRTLRTFTQQLAKEAGYEVEWDRFGASAVGRDLLYIARDRSVNELAKPHAQNENTIRQLIYTRDRLEGNRDLPDLLRDVVRPTRALTFERTRKKGALKNHTELKAAYKTISEEDALKKHPELKEAYKKMREAGSYFAEKMPGNVKAQEQGIQSFKNHVQKRLNSGETTDFTRERVDEKQQKKPQPQQQRSESEQER